MTLQSSGEIKISEIAAEYTGVAPHSLSEYYRSGALVDNTKGQNASGTKSDEGDTTNFGSVTNLTVSRATGTGTVSATAPGTGKFTLSSGLYYNFKYEFHMGDYLTAGFTQTSPYIRKCHVGIYIDGKAFNGGLNSQNWTDAAGKQDFSYTTVSDGTNYGLTVRYRFTRNGSTVPAGQGVGRSQIGFPTQGNPRPETLMTITISGTPTSNVVIGFGSDLNFNEDNMSQVNGTPPVNPSNLGGSGTGTVYDFSCTNNTGVSGTMNGTTVSNGATVEFDSDNTSSSLACTWASQVNINQNIPTSGALALSDYYDGENAP
jgi:hypothetical protein